MFIVCPSTLWNKAVLETQSAPKRILGRVMVFPRKGASGLMILRLILEVQVLRYFLPLIPFAAAMLVWPDLALPIAQAPLIMLLVIAFVEIKLLSIDPEKRKAVMGEADAASARDALRYNATRLLTRLAAMRQVSEGELMLVVEQSEIARVPPLTLVSLQRPAPDAEVMDLSEEERALITEGLFTDGLTERALHRAGLREGDCLHSVTIDARSVSAHARMTALLDQKRAVAAEA